MKKIIFCLTLLFSQGVQSQITLDFQTSAYFLFNFMLNNSETKYFESNFNKINSLNQFTLYNMDGSLYKNIQMPPKPDPQSQIIGIFSVSESLFDNDPSNIEYLVLYDYCDSLLSGSQRRTKVIREDGTVLLDEADAWCDNSFFSFTAVYATEEGSKLQLLYSHIGSFDPYQSKVFSLPGQIPTSLNNKLNPEIGNLSVYPNPNNGAFYIRLRTQDDYLNTIDLYSSTGQLISTYKTTNDLLHVINPGLTDGVYFVTARSRILNSTKTMIIKK
jgi:hypothetical protein